MKKIKIAGGILGSVSLVKLVVYAKIIGIEMIQNIFAMKLGADGITVESILLMFATTLVIIYIVQEGKKK